MELVIGLTSFYGYDKIDLWIIIFAQLAKKNFTKRYIENVNRFIVVQNVLTKVGV